MRILLACDETLAAALSVELRRLGVEARAGSDVPTALMTARREDPDAIVVSGHLPGGGGPALVTRLRGLVSTALTPVLGIHENPEQRERLEAAGADACLQATTHPASLCEALRSLSTGDSPVLEVPRELLVEPDRAEILDALDLEPDVADPTFEQVAALASNLLPAPTSHVTLVEEDRQWFPGRSDSRPSPAAPARETPLSQSFCQWVVTSAGPLVVEDSREHPLLRFNRAVDELGVVAYVGMPLILRGQALGTVCAIDYEPRVWDDENLAVLDLLAKTAVAELRLRMGGTEAAVTAQARACSSAIGSLTQLMRRVGPMTGDAVRRIAELIDRFNGRVAQLGEISSSRQPA